MTEQEDKNDSSKQNENDKEPESYDFQYNRYRTSRTISVPCKLYNKNIII